MLDNVVKRHLIIDGLNTKYLTFPDKKEFCLRTVTQKSCLSFQTAGLPYRSQTCQPHNHMS